MSEVTVQRYPESGVFRERHVSAFIATDQHKPGDHVHNFLADAFTMLDSDMVDEADRRFLDHAVRCCIREARDGSGRQYVWMNGSQWGRFIGAQRRYRGRERERHRERYRALMNRTTKPTSQASQGIPV